MTIYAGFIYPVVAHWAWDVGYGWLVEGVTYSNETIAYQDFAGSGVVHVVGGAAAIVGAFFVGPRLGRFTEVGEVHTIQGHTVTVITRDVFIIRTLTTTGRFCHTC
jgi:Amt family ammonium transporter